MYVNMEVYVYGSMHVWKYVCIETCMHEIGIERFRTTSILTAIVFSSYVCLQQMPYQ